MQRRLQSACRDATHSANWISFEYSQRSKAALLTDNSSQKEEATTDIRSQAAQAVQPAQLADSKQASKPLCQAVPADEGAGRQGVRLVYVSACVLFRALLFAC